jgi:lycopene beta-cyclase
MSARAERAARYDVVIVGGGLAGQLCALGIRSTAPDLSVALVERAKTLEGNKVWCCHGSDLAITAKEQTSLHGWFLALVDARWPYHRVCFPGFERRIDGEYLCLRSESLARATSAALAAPAHAIFVDRAVRKVDRREVLLETGEALHGSVVLDARGDDPTSYGGKTGFQKFLGWEIETARGVPPRLTTPILMDATVEQIDGFRFAYVLPFSSSRLLVEDTYFSRRAACDAPTMRTRLGSYLRANGIDDFEVVREEGGVLPMPWARARRNSDEALAIGYRGGFFHPGTGYSLGRGVIVAHHVATVLRDAPVGERRQSVQDGLERLRRAWSADDHFGRWLNRLAFRVVPPAWLRQNVFARVYRLPQPVLERFYAGRTSLRDRLAVTTAPLRIPIPATSEGHVPLLGENP